MNRSLIISSVLHAMLIFITAMSLPFLAKKPLDIPPIVSVELIQIAEKTNVPFAPKACLLYTSPSPRDATLSRMPSSA